MNLFRMMTPISAFVSAAMLALMIALVPSAAGAYTGSEVTATNTVEVPAPPAVDDPCGLDNATWIRPTDDGLFAWSVMETGELVVTIVAPDTTFPDGVSTTYGYGAPPDSGVSCEIITPTQQVHWTPFEQACMNGTMSSAHRGMGVGMTRFGGRSYAEDTLGALARGLSLKVCAVETDFWETSNGCLMSHHDSTLNRMTNETGVIKRKNCSYVERARHANGARVPTFQEIQRRLRVTAPWTCFRQQEIKRGSVTRNGLRRMVAFNATVAKSPACIMYTAAEAKPLRYLHQISPESKLGLIHRSIHGRPAISRVPRFVDRIMIDYRAVTHDYVRRANRAGFEVSARNVDSIGIFSRMKRLGVRYIVTNAPWVIQRHR